MKDDQEVNTPGDTRSAPAWRTSSYSSADSYCIETSTTGGLQAVRDSKAANGPRLGFSPESWARFVRATRG